MTGLDTAHLAPGSEANLVALDGHGHMEAIFIRGKRV
jgi:N-acetylglucosamine-6-phosphate deacetylase